MTDILQHAREKIFRGTVAKSIEDIQADITALQAAVAAIPMSSINSIQRGTISVSIGVGASSATNTATLSPTVDPTKSVCFFGGWTTSGSDSDEVKNAAVELTDGSTVTATAARNITTGSAAAAVRWTVVEFN